MGEQIASCRPNCQSTQMECACENKKGGHSVTAIDLGEISLPLAPSCCRPS